MRTFSHYNTSQVCDCEHADLLRGRHDELHRRLHLEQQEESHWRVVQNAGNVFHSLLFPFICLPCIHPSFLFLLLFAHRILYIYAYMHILQASPSAKPTVVLQRASITNKITGTKWAITPKVLWPIAIDELLYYCCLRALVVLLQIDNTSRLLDLSIFYNSFMLVSSPFSLLASGPSRPFSSVRSSTMANKIIIINNNHIHTNSC